MDVVCGDVLAAMCVCVCAMQCIDVAQTIQ